MSCGRVEPASPPSEAPPARTREGTIVSVTTTPGTFVWLYKVSGFADATQIEKTVEITGVRIDVSLR